MLVSRSSSLPERPKVVMEQVADSLDRHVRRRAGRHLGGAGVMALAYEHGRLARVPDPLHRGQDAQLVVDEDVVLGGKSSLDVVELAFLVDVDQDAALD